MKQIEEYCEEDGLKLQVRKIPCEGNADLSWLEFRIIDIRKGQPGETIQKATLVAYRAKRLMEVLNQ